MDSHLEVADARVVRAIMPWFPDAHQAARWGGPRLRHPFDEASLREDLRMATVPSRVLRDDDGAVVAFGQYYARAGRCHLARLAVAPQARGRGLGEGLVRALVREAYGRLGLDECGLFVYPDNAPAVRLYERLGFTRQANPDPSPDFAACQYMTAPTATVMRAAPAAAATSDSTAPDLTAQDPMAAPYVPIACGFHDRLEHFAVRAEVVALELRRPEGVQHLRARIADVYARAGADYARLVPEGDGDAIEVRLDLIDAVNGVVRPGAC